MLYTSRGVVLLFLFLTRLSLGLAKPHQLHNNFDSIPNQNRVPTDIAPPPPITHVLETCLYVRNMNRSVKFYKDTLGLDNFMKTPRLSAFDMKTTTLLLFHLGETSEDIDYEGSPGRGQIAGHGPDLNIVNALGLGTAPIMMPNGTTPLIHPEVSLKLHFAFAVEKREDVFQWEEHFRRSGVHIHSTMEWERGGRSVYFYDPDGHVGEIVSRGIWPHW